MATITLSSCQKFNDINERLDKVESELNELKALQDAFNQAKVISSYSPITDAGTEGWSITFTDGTIIRIISEHLITSITEDEKTHVVTMLLADGSTFTFNTQYIIPSSIVLLNTKPIELSTGAQASIEFRVNPSTAVFDYSEENCQIELDKAGTVQTKASYVTKPQNYKLVKIEQVVDEETKEVLTGQYRAVIEDTGRSAEYDEVVALVLNTKDAKGNDIQISSSVVEVIGKNFDNLPHNGLPVVMINTPNATPIASKDDYVEGSYITLLNADMTYDYQGEMKIKGRGNSTWGAPKKPYKVKFDKKQSLFGEPKDKEWVLLANYYDKSALRTELTFYMASKYGCFDYVPRFVYSDLMLNGSYYGLFQLGEQLKISSDRVNVGDGGFLLEIDFRATSEDAYFFTSKINRPVNIKDPEVALNSDGYNYVRDYVLAAENALYSDNFTDPVNGYYNYIDMDSFVEWYLVSEIAKNRDSNTNVTGSSIYMHFAQNGKIVMGPLWDFDLAFGNSSFSESDGYTGFWIKDSFWYERLFQDPVFVNKVKERFNVYYSHKADLIDHIDEIAQIIQNAAVMNYLYWYRSDNNRGAALSEYSNHVESLKSWLISRLEWLKEEFDAM